ncbi:MAG: ABC transporter substrate-binding protein [Christensenellales bacterium]
MKKLIAFSLCVIMLLSATSAFAATEIEFAFWMSEQQDEIFAMVEKYNQSQDEVHVTANLISSGYWDKMSVAIPSGEAADVFMVNALHMVDYITNGYLLDIADLFETGAIDLANYAPSTYMTSTVNGKTWGVPKDYDTIAIAYNKAVFDAAGVEYPKNGWTWDEFVETCKAIKEATGIYGVALNGDMQSLGYLTFASGGKDFNEDGTCALNSEEVIGAYQACADLIHVDQVAPTIEELNEIDAETMFLSEMVAMVFCGSWNVNYYGSTLGDNFAIVTLPLYNGTEKNIVHSLSYVGYAQTDAPEATKDFLVFLASEEAQEMTYTTVIPAFNGLADKWAARFENLDLTGYTTSVPNGTAQPLPCAPKNSAEIYTAMCNMIADCLMYNTVPETVAKYTDQINELLK